MKGDLPIDSGNFMRRDLNNVPRIRVSKLAFGEWRWQLPISLRFGKGRVVETVI